MDNPTLKPASLFFAAFFCCSIFLSTDAAAQLYRYKDDQGNYVLNQTIPPKYVKKGYDILNNQGRVIRTVAPELTPEQIAARDAALEEERLRKIEAQKQALIDNELKQQFSHPNEAVHVLSRRVVDMQSLIKAKQSRIKTLENNIIEEETRAATRQRQGLRILESTLKQIDKFKSDISINEHDIAEVRSELKNVKAEFDKKIRRLEVITGKEASDYQKLLEDFEKAEMPDKENQEGKEAQPLPSVE